MEIVKIHLKDRFPFLAENGKDPTLTAYLQDHVGDREIIRPCLVVCPGGGYGNVAPREAEPVAMDFLPTGFQIFVLTYSIAPHGYPSQLREVAAVMELLQENAAAWRCDPQKIALMGFSAGGHLAAHYANSYDSEAVRQVFPSSKPVQASVLCYPVISVDPKFTHYNTVRRLTGCEPEDLKNPEQFSCDKLVTKNTPPTFIWHTEEDELVPVMNSRLYAQALKANGIAHELYIYPKGQHGLATVDFKTCRALTPEVSVARQWVSNARRWLTDTLQFG